MINALRIPMGLVPLFASMVQVVEAIVGVAIVGAAIVGNWKARKAEIGRREIRFFMMSTS